MDMLPPTTVPDDIRVMTPEEVALEAPIFEANGSPLPDPAVSVFLGVFRGGKRVAFLVIQLRLHAEPLWIEEGHSAVLPSLVKFAENYIIQKTGPQWLYLFTPAGKVTQLATHMGFQMEPWVVMSRLVVPETPDKIGIDLSILPVSTEGVQ